mmetsp:Transcript_6768/g.11773  ORF Transcript_6768/g.11773 Transcript_6768/m.11773 type:complete len:196 (-) Transcript_6768:947-1534(-)
MKRPFEHRNGGKTSLSAALSCTEKKMPPFVIEPDDCTSCRTTPDMAQMPASKRPRTSYCDCSSLNLLVQAVENISGAFREDEEDGRGNGSAVVDRIPPMCHEIAQDHHSVRSDASVAASSEAGTVASSEGPSPLTLKNLILKRGMPLLPPRFPTLRRVGPIPAGRPLMPPPRLPGNLKPGQILTKRRITAPQSSS